MLLHHLIECCISTDPSVIPGDYTIVFSGSKSGALGEGILMFTAAELPKDTVDRIEYRLVSILLLLADLAEYRSEQANQRDFQVTVGSDFASHITRHAEQLIDALQERGIKRDLAMELILGRHRMS